MSHGSRMERSRVGCRACDAVDEPTAFLEGANQPVLVQCIGYTPIRKVKRANWYDEGAGNSCGYLLEEDGRYSHPAGQVFARWQTGHWPPNATVTIDYVIYPEKRQAEISLAGTVVPCNSPFGSSKRFRWLRMWRRSSTTASGIGLPPISRPGRFPWDAAPGPNGRVAWLADDFRILRAGCGIISLYENPAVFRQGRSREDECSGRHRDPAG